MSLPLSLQSARTGSAQPRFALLFALACGLLLVQMIAQFWPDTAWTLPDTDDALRLTEVRAFLHGRGWYDLLEPRLGLGAGYESHWSRLIDAGLGGLYLGFRLFAGHAMAERLMVTVWPALWLLPTLAGAVAIAWRLAGREAAVVTLLLAVFNIPGLQQFRFGRIDHHNVQIALAMLVVAATLWSDRRTWAAPAAGALTGLSLAIGLEGLPIHVVCGAALTLCFVADDRHRGNLRRYGLALAATTVGAFLVSVGPQHWLRSACDDLAVNSAVAVMVCGLGVALLTVWRGPSWHRLPGVVAVAAVAVGLFVAIEPRCLGGPYAMMDPAVRPIWLAHVSEMQPLWALVARAPLTAIAVAAYPVAALVAMLALLRDRQRRDAAHLIAAAAFLMAFAVMAGAMKGFSYALWLGLPLVAAAAMALFVRLRLQSLAARFVIALLLTPSLFTVGVMSAAEAAGITGAIDFNAPARQACVRHGGYAALAKLPPGRVLADELLWGPYILAWTPHRVVAGPYHRMSDAILAAQHAWSAPPAAAHDRLSRLHVGYLVLCGGRGPIGLDGAPLAASLWGRLAAGDVPAWLTPVSAPGQPVTIYRVTAEPAGSPG